MSTVDCQLSSNTYTPLYFDTYWDLCILVATPVYVYTVYLPPPPPSIYLKVLFLDEEQCTIHALHRHASSRVCSNDKWCWAARQRCHRPLPNGVEGCKRSLFAWVQRARPRQRPVTINFGFFYMLGYLKDTAEALRLSP